MTDNQVKKVIIIGGGLVGSLCAVFMAKRGYKVTVYERREDIRQSKLFPGRSINLALSNRGLRALEFVGLKDDVLKNAIPMKGRLLHTTGGLTKSILYDSRTHQCIYSISRNYLNKILLTAAQRYVNVRIDFRHKMTSCNFDEGTVTVLNLESQESRIDSADLIIGADGAFSTLRRFMQHKPIFQFSQTYIEHGYIELAIPEKNSSKMVSNHLHIWPRGEFMMIALPNQDRSWTVTVFMPFEKFTQLKEERNVKLFFEQTFPDSVPLIGKEEITDIFMQVKPSHLLSIKCSPYHFGTKFLLIGDAAHAMVPFYGQGMNAGFEDCLILNRALEENYENIEVAIREFTSERVKNAQAICDLAMYNYVEMRDLILRKSFYIRKILDNFLFTLFPRTWIPLYNSVTFSDMAYKECLENKKWQDKIIQRSVWFSGLCVLLFFCSFSN